MTSFSAKSFKRALRYGCGLSLLLALGGCPPTGAPQTSRTATPQELTQAAELDYATHAMTGMLGRKSFSDASVILSDLAAQGNPLAQTALGRAKIYGDGSLVAQNPQDGVSLLNKAADLGYVQAKSDLAGIYMNGQGVAKDPAKARALAEEAAHKGNLDAIEMLAIWLFNGEGSPKDEKAGVSWAMKAADKGRATSMLMLGAAYQDGRGVDADKLLSYVWYGEAAKRSYQPGIRNFAAKSRDNAALALGPDDLALGNRIIDVWVPGQSLADLRRQLASNGAQAPAAPAAAQPQAQPTEALQAATNVPVVYRVMNTSVEVSEDGSSVSTTHMEIQPRNEASAHELGQFPLTYDSQREQLEVVEAYTLKPDGRKLNVDPKTIQEQLVPGKPRIPMFDLERQKVLILRDLQPGDIAVITYKTRNQPDFPGRYSLTQSYDRTWAVMEQKLTVSFPASFTPNVEEHGVTASRREVNGRHLMEWTYSNPHPVVEEKFAVSPLDRNPRLFLSNYKNYEDLGRTYAELVKGSVSVTPEVRKLADEITQGVSDRRRQAELLHDWVSHHIRYVQVRLGAIGGMKPHDVGSILANGYGDCKDHSVLYASLLKSKGIESELVLINLGNGYGLPTAPTYGLLNHMIVWLPDFQIYDDTTAEVAPFGVLDFWELGKPTVHASLTASRLSRTPSAQDLPAETTVRTTARMDAAGGMEGDTEVTATGAFAIELRQRALGIQSQGKEQAAKALLSYFNNNGSASFDFASPYEPGNDYRISAHFKFNARPDLMMGNSFNMPYGLNAGWRPGDDLLGPLDLLDANGVEASPCFKGRQVAELTLELPPGKKLRDLPKNVTKETSLASFKTEWSQDGHQVKLRRELVSRVDGGLCVGDPRRQTARLQNDIRQESYSSLSLVDE